MPKEDKITKDGAQGSGQSNDMNDLSKTILAHASDGVEDAVKDDAKQDTNNDDGKVGDDDKVKPTDTEPPPDHPRFHEVYGKMKSYERQVDELKKQLEEMKKLNEQLVSKMDKVVSHVESDEHNKVMSEYQAKVNALEQEVKELKEQRKKAMEDLDYDKVDELDDLIFEKRLELNELKSNKPDVKKQNDQSGETQPQQTQQPQQAGLSEDDQKVLNEWLSENSWFNDDMELRAAAIGIEAEMIAKIGDEWNKKPLVERLNQVKNEVIKRYSKTDKAKLLGSVGDGGSGGVSHQGGNNQTDLTPEERHLARQFGISEEDWLKSKVGGGI